MKRTKVLSLFLAAMFLLSGLAASHALAQEKITIKYWVPFTSNQYIQSLNESEMYKELERRTGVHVDFIHPSDQDRLEQFYLMLNARTLPDVIATYPGSYPGGVDKAIRDGAYLRLNELIDQYAPNFRKLLEEDPELAREITTDEGNIWAFHLVRLQKTEPVWWGPVLRGDWLEELGLEVPTTIDEWYNVLTQFKEKKGAKAPLVISAYGIDPYGGIISAFDIGPGFFQEDGVVKYGPAQPAFKDYLTTMHKWYTEGLIDRDFVTRDSQGRAALITSGDTGAYMTEYALVDRYLASLATTDPDATFVPAPPPTLRPGEKVRYNVPNVHIRSGGYPAAITTSAKHPERIVEWLDYAFGEEGFMLFNYGIEGVSYEMVDGQPQFTDLLVNNPDGYDYWTVCNKWKLDVGPYLRDFTAVAGGFSDFDMAAMEVWSDTDSDLVFPAVSLTAEEDEKASLLFTDIRTYKDEMVLKFIVGEVPLSEFDNYIAQLNKMKIQEVIDIYQNALDRYYSR